MSDRYRTFLESKVKLAKPQGFEVDSTDINPAVKDFAREIVRWAVRGGRRAIFSAFGLHKTSVQLECARLIVKHTKGRALIVLPLGVRQEFFDEVRQRFTGAHAVRLKFIKTTAELEDQETPIDPVTPWIPLIHVTNYEPVRDGKIAVDSLTFISLDEAAILRGYGTKT